MLAVVSGTAGNAVADRKDFVLTQLAFLGEATPGEEPFSAVFESNVINNRGDVLFGSSFPQEAGAPLVTFFSGCGLSAAQGQSRLRSRGPASRLRGAVTS